MANRRQPVLSLPILLPKPSGTQVDAPKKTAVSQLVGSEDVAGSSVQRFRQACVQSSAKRSTLVSLLLLCCFLKVGLIHCADKYGLPFSRPNYRILVSDGPSNHKQQLQRPSLSDLYEIVSRPDSRAKLYGDLARARDLIEAQLAAKNDETNFNDNRYNDNESQQQVRYLLDNSNSNNNNNNNDLSNINYRSMTSDPSSVTYGIDGPLAAVATSPSENSIDSTNDLTNLNIPINDLDPKLLYQLAASLNSDRAVSEPNNNDNNAAGVLEIDPRVVATGSDADQDYMAAPAQQRVEEKRRTNNDNNQVMDDVMSQDQDRSQRPARVVTLLEDDESINGTSRASRASSDTTNQTVTATTEEPTFGRVILGAEDDSTNQIGAASEPQTTGNTSIFKRMYSKLASYLPFLQQISILNHPKTPVKTNDDIIVHQVKNSSELDAIKTPPVTTAPPVVNTKQRFSGDDVDNDKDASGNNKRQSSDDAVSSKQQQKDKQVTIKLIRNHETDGMATANNNLIGDQKGNPNDDNINLDTAETSVKPTKVNLFRQSSLVLPLEDDMVLHASIKKNINQPQAANLADSFEGKYIYAPTQHYYLGSLDSNADEPIRRTTNIPAAIGGHHFRPGDEIRSSYGGMGVAEPPTVSALLNGGHSILASPEDYTQHKIGPSDHRSQNDAYFLVMVGAFCVMAVAMVLSAGMFAYRLQQNRKSTIETDYPTYGVVGPNNACAILNGGTGKCGATSFVGGYFGGGSEPGSSRGSLYASKTGSAKHLPDLYGSDSGVDKSSLSAITGVSNSNNSNGNKKGADSQASLANAAGAAAANGSMSVMGGFVANQDAARMYHYQHQKQQMIQTSDHRKCGSMAGAGGVVAGGRHASASDLDSDDENEDGSYTVYECPGLASAHEMEIKNPLFNDDQSP